MIQKILANLKIEKLNEMQQAVLKTTESKNEIVLLSPTGSGKTLAFLLPVLASLKTEVVGVQTLILVPSRELAMQIENVFKSMGTGFKINCCYGGHDTKVERNNFLHPPAVLVGTPGRIMYHIERETFDTKVVHTLVLDEFDKSLEFGFQKEMEFIIQHLPNLYKRMLTSATKCAEIPAFAGLTKPEEINFLKEHVTPQLTLKTVRAEENDKLKSLMALLAKIGNETTLVFCNHRDAVDRISEILKKSGVIHDVYHGKLEQDERQLALVKFRNGSNQILITTDLASRGLDIPAIRHVIHYQLPNTLETYTHRNGRTARMHAEGTAYLILSAEEYIPPFIKDAAPEMDLPSKYKFPAPSEWATIYISAGKKDKVNKIDIVGFLIQKGGLLKEELGLIEVQDFIAYAAVKRNKVSAVLEKVKGQKLKNKSVKMVLQE
ncbi:MAG: DEAD/DEAH box helicase [Bacteroidetes bacterium]|nr:DEAD/DEAH box helicase [Bacteroidota bacterium]